MNQQGSLNCPWLAAVFNSYGYVCNGVILNRHWVLTAGHYFSTTTSRYTPLTALLQYSRYKQVFKIEAYSVYIKGHSMPNDTM